MIDKHCFTLQFFVRAVDGGGLHSDVPVEVYVMSPADRPPRFEKRDSGRADH